MAASRAPLLDPQRAPERIAPYPPIWRPIVIEKAILLIVAAGIFGATNYIGLNVPASLVPILGAALLLLPLGLWAIFTLLPESRSAFPRRRLIVVTVITMLAANAVALPFIDQVLQPETWLPNEDAVNRILGYTFTFGIVGEIVKYTVLRYTVWDDLLRVRGDAVVYAAAAALGYATVLNLHFLTDNPGASLDVLALRIAENVIISLAGGLFISLGLAETRFANPTPFFMTITVALASILTGAAQALLGALVNATFSVRGVFDRPLFGLALTVGLFVITVVMIAFFYTSIERREREFAKGRERRL